MRNHLLLPPKSVQEGIDWWVFRGQVSSRGVIFSPIRVPTRWPLTAWTMFPAYLNLNTRIGILWWRHCAIAVPSITFRFFSITVS